MAIEYTGAGGVRHNYGPISTAADSSGGVVSRESVRGDFHQLEIDFDAAHLPASGAGSLSTAQINDALVGGVRIPAGSLITRAYLYVGTAWVGGTVLTLGLTNATTGAVVSATSVVDATQGAVANLTAGSWRAGSVTGAVVAVDSVLTATPTGTFTAGSGKLVVEYLRGVG